MRRLQNVSILFTDLFDSLSTFIGVANAAGLVDRDGRPINLRRGLIVDACATFGAGLVGTSPGTAYVESIPGYATASVLVLVGLTMFQTVTTIDFGPLEDGCRHS